MSTERVRLEWTQDAGRAQWTDKLTYNQLPIDRDRAHEGKYRTSVHTGTRVERSDLSSGLRSDTEMRKRPFSYLCHASLDLVPPAVSPIRQPLK